MGHSGSFFLSPTNAMKLRWVSLSEVVYMAASSLQPLTIGARRMGLRLRVATIKPLRPRLISITIKVVRGIMGGMGLSLRFNSASVHRAERRSLQSWLITKTL